MKKKFLQHTQSFIAISLFIHMCLWLSMYVTSNSKTKSTKEIIEIDYMSNLEQKQSTQIVQQDKSINEQAPDSAKYLSKKNQRVAEETKAENTGKFNNTVSVGQKGKSKTAAKKKASTTNSQAVADGDIPSLKELKPKFNFMNQVENDSFQPSKGISSQTDDHLKDVKSGLQTMLNTKEFVYYSYYQRIRNKIRQFWEPAIREKVRKIFAQGRNIASTRDRVTRVIIVLDNGGSLLKVQVVGQSGFHDLDEAATEAFRAAEPFPNPPKGMIEKDGTVKIRWDFILEAQNNKKKAQKNASFSGLRAHFSYIS